MNAPKLKPCKRCGAMPTIYQRHEIDGCIPAEWRVVCERCDIMVSGETRSDAVAAWNRRAKAEGGAE